MEDAVREELIAPLLRALGYSSSPPHRIVRSKKLKHPYVYFGTVKKEITIIPDYVLEVDGQYAWILDAKAPTEDIDTGTNVEQAYSYAMHRDIRVPLYGLCNGRKLVVFHVSEEKPLIDVQLTEISTCWLKVLNVIGSKSAWPEGRKPGFLPDLGLSMSKAGLAEDVTGKKHFQMFIGVPILMVTKIEDDLYTFNAQISNELFEQNE